MIFSTLIVVLVASGDAGRLTEASVSKAAEQSLPVGSAVLVRDVGELPSDEGALSTASELGAEVVVVLRWSPDQRVSIHLHRRGASAWADRDINFEAGDVPAERGRAVGFAVASMVPPPAPDPPLDVPPAATRPLAPRDIRARAAPVSAPRLAIDVLGLAGAGIGGDAGGLGAELSGRYWPWQRFAIRAGVGARFGEFAQAGASSSVWRLSAGAAWEAASWGDFVIGVRVDALVLRHGLSRPVGDGTTSSGGRWLPAVDALGEASLGFAKNAAVFAALGAEVALGETRVFVADQRVADIARLRVVSEIGFRMRFGSR